MKPHPSVTVSEVSLDFRNPVSWEDDSKDYYVHANWRFEGYQYRSRRIRARSPAEKIDVEIELHGHWYPASTKALIGQALLRD